MFENVSFCQPLVAAFHSPGERDLGALSRLPRNRPNCLTIPRTKVPMGVVEAVNGNIKALLRRGRGYRDLNYLLLKAQRLAATKTEFVAFSESRVECALLQIVVQNRKCWDACGADAISRKSRLPASQPMLLPQESKRKAARKGEETNQSACEPRQDNPKLTG